MAKRTLTAAILSLGAVVALTIPARAGAIVLTVPSYDSPTGYDFVTTFPPSGSATIGTFTIPLGITVTGITISGSFGNGDSGTTALSDYYLGFAGDETAVEVANCDSIFADCYSAQNGPTTWTYTLTASNRSTLASAIAAGSLNFTYTWDTSASPPIPGFSGFDQYVYAGLTTLTIQTAPEPASVVICLSGLAGIAALRRFRRV